MAPILGITLTLILQCRIQPQNIYLHFQWNSKQFSNIENYYFQNKVIPNKSAYCEPTLDFLRGIRFNQIHTTVFFFVTAFF